MYVDVGDHTRNRRVHIGGTPLWPIQVDEKNGHDKPDMWSYCLYVVRLIHLWIEYVLDGLNTLCYPERIVSGH